MKFTTKDVDNDNWPNGNCAQDWHGAWWFGWCSLAHLNADTRGKIAWFDFKNLGYSYTFRCKVAEMKVAPREN